MAKGKEQNCIAPLLFSDFKGARECTDWDFQEIYYSAYTVSYASCAVCQTQRSCKTAHEVKKRYTTPVSNLCFYKYSSVHPIYRRRPQALGNAISPPSTARRWRGWWAAWWRAPGPGRPPPPSPPAPRRARSSGRGWSSSPSRRTAKKNKRTNAGRRG